MQLISFTYKNQKKFGCINGGGGIVDISAHLKCQDIGHALAEHGADRLKDLAANKTNDLSLNSISQYRPAVADPKQIFCIGLNYEEHRVEANRQRTPHPTVFLRLPASQLGHLQPILCPIESNCLDYEGEIAIVIGRGGRRIKPEKAWDHIFGLSAYNDVSIRDWQAHSTQWSPGKNFPNTGAFGPYIVSTDDIDENEHLTLQTFLNNELVQTADTSMMLFRIPELIAYISTFTQLYPGDVIVTGTPGGVGFKRQPPLYMKDGDEVVVEVSKVGRLINTVEKERL